MKIQFTSILVDDQEKALRFYTEKLGFTKMADIPFGEFRWLTVTSPDGAEGVEVVLEPGTLATFAPGVAHGLTAESAAFAVSFGSGTDPVADTIPCPELGSRSAEKTADT
jgi:catechol 2,3-dioxygenase-like lactoylglutathione lyase family enzyme